MSDIVIRNYHWTDKPLLAQFIEANRKDMPGPRPTVDIIQDFENGTIQVLVAGNKTSILGIQTHSPQRALHGSSPAKIINQRMAIWATCL